MESATDISFFHTILVLAEDKGKLTKADLAHLGSSRQLLGALGRLEGLRYIERVKDETGDFFILSEQGDETLAEILEAIPDPNTPWDGKWRMILFDIPEAKRSLRQLYRMKLADLGARMLQSSVWITPYERVINRFQTFASQPENQSAIHFFTAQPIDISTIDVPKLWRLPELEQEYKALFRSLEKEYKQLAHTSDASFRAKCMIVRLALIARKDPLLSEKIMPKNWIGYQVSEWYKKLRTYCQ